jgi:hypothetical protein
MGRRAHLGRSIVAFSTATVVTAITIVITVTKGSYD